MIRCMQHRGGDSQQVLTPARGSSGHSVVLGISERRDVDEDGRHAGFFSRERDCLVVDGRILNTRTLRNRLAAEGVAIGNGCDAEVVMLAIASWGPQAIGQFDGCFAIAYYDYSSNALWFARGDASGRPLYFAESRDRIVFASEVKAILATGLVPEELDKVGVATCLAYGRLLGPRTLHTAITSIAPATYRCIKLNSSGPSLSPAVRHWSPRASDSNENADDDALLAAHRALQKIVSVDSRTAKQSCVLLSDGISSACLAASFRSSGAEDSFTVGVDGVSEAVHDSENAFAFGRYQREQVTDVIRDAAASAIALGLHHHQAVVDRDWAVSQVPEWLHFMDQPTIGGLDSSILINSAIDKGFRTQFSGIGGAELLGASKAHLVVPRLLRLMKASRWLPRRWIAARAARLLRSHGIDDAAMDNDAFFGGRSCFRFAMRLHRVIGNQALRSLGLAAEQLGTDADFLDDSAIEPKGETSGDVYRCITNAEVMLALIKQGELLALGDINGADIRTPYLERELQEVIAKVPSRVCSALGDRYGSVLQGLAATILPHEIACRPRSSWSFQSHAWRYYSSSDVYARHVEAFVGSGVAPPEALHSLWEKARRQPDPRQAVIIAAIGAYLGELPKVIATAKQ
jgi:asparagine synthase (glutamine-hydrolysing)